MRTILLLAPVVAAPVVADAAVVRGRIVLQDGDAPEGDSAVVNVGAPVVNALGEVGFVGNLADGDHFVFIGTGVAWLGSDGTGVFSSAEAAVDSNGFGRFVYPPDIDGLDALFGDAGLLGIEGQPAPALGNGIEYVFHTLPTMTADGTIYWIVGYDDDGDGINDGRALLRSEDGTPQSIEVLLRSGDQVDGFTIDVDVASIANAYAVSEDGQHRIHVLGTTADATQDVFVRVDESFVLREGDATGDGDAWQVFDLTAINSSGNWMATGDTNGAVATDEFVAYNGAVVAREGSEVGGIVLGSPASLRHIAINDLDQAAHVWGYESPDGFRESAFFVCDVGDFVASTQTLVTTVDDELDVDGDGVGDYTIADVSASAPTWSRVMGETPFVYLAVVLDDGAVSRDAMVELRVSCCGNGAVNPFEECDDGNADDTDDCLATCEVASCGDGFVRAGIEACDDGNAVDTDDCPRTCEVASCGDGFVHAGVEECDDTDADDSDACLSSCEAARCGDGFVRTGVEECDDGNTEDGDECAADCTFSVAGTSTEGGLDTSSSSELTTDAPSDTSAPTTGTSSEGSGGSDDAETGAAGEDGGCGCDTGSRRVPWWTITMLGFGRRARRRVTSNA
jgi:cysteine-rich repeat protein